MSYTNPEHYKKFKRSKKGVIHDIYFAQRFSSKQRNHNYPTYSYEEFKEYCIKNKQFDILYNTWVSS
jgi:hypothetical protein